MTNDIASHWSFVIRHLLQSSHILRKGSPLSANKINIVGIGDDGLEGLTSAARQLVEKAEMLIGARQSLTAAAAGKAEKVEIGGDLEATVRKIESAAGKRIVVLTAGDPLFY